MCIRDSPRSLAPSLPRSLAQQGSHRPVSRQFGAQPSLQRALVAPYPSSVPGTAYHAIAR
eukprot:1983195-Rhodomonas_salina.1